MDKTINMTFKSCMVDGDQLIEDDGKNEPLYHDIAAILDITEQQVKVNIFRARQAVKKKISPFL